MGARTKRVRCKSGLSGWQCRLRKNYRGFKEFEAYDQSYGLSRRLGYADARAAWNANPEVRGSVDPGDFEIVRANDGRKAA